MQYELKHQEKKKHPGVRFVLIAGDAQITSQNNPISHRSEWSLPVVKETWM